MKPSADVERLAALIESLRNEDPPRTLPILIGDLCGERAGVPSPAEMGRAALRSLFEQTPDYASKLLPAGPDATDDQVETAFLFWLRGMTHLQRYRVLEPFYRRVPVPLFYQDLADLVLGGFVTHILTTNVDTLLEQALDTIGLAAGLDYSVQVLGSPDPTSIPTGPPTPTTIIKLYGDLGQEQLPMGPDEIDKVITENRSFLRSELAKDLIVVGHEVDNVQPRAIDHWLARGTGEIWWVHPEPPANDVMAPIADNRLLTYLTGAMQGEPEAFFGQLNTYLIRLPAVEVLGSEPMSAGDAAFEFEFLKSRIEKAQVTKYAFEQNVSAGDDNIGLQAQIGYQADRVATYGSQLRDLAPLNLRVLLTRLVAEAETAGVDPSTVEFLTQQTNVVDRELSSSTPNELLISGAVSALNSVAQGLGPQLSPELTTELRSATYGFGMSAS